MKKTILVVPLSFIFACSNQPEQIKDVPAKVTVADIKADSPKAEMENDIFGYYSGPFDAQDIAENRSYFYRNKITIAIDSIGDAIITGHSIVAGNNRPFRGTYKLVNGNYIVEAPEPGDDKYDGVFSFELNPAAHTIEGTWVANNKKLEVVKRSYTLLKREFSYNAGNDLSREMVGNVITDWNNISKFDEGDAMEEVITEDAVRFNASVIKLKKEDVENMYKGDLEIMRNAIYARHGYSFKNRRIRYIFDNEVDWYMPVTTDVRNDLSELEKENIKLIKRYEEHAGKYYDSFGR